MQTKNHNFFQMESDEGIRCYGITKDSETNNFMMVINCKYNLCEECKQPNTGRLWCQSCNAQHFQQNFKIWTSGNHDIDEFIQNVQLKAKSCQVFLEWIEYDKFENVECLFKGEFETVYKAIWKNGYIYHWDSENDQWERRGGYGGYEVEVVLKCLDITDITVDLLKMVIFFI